MPRADILLQLIPGHEAIGTVVQMGKNVKDFAKGDRVVADVGITVSSFFCFWLVHQPTCSCVPSARTVSTAVVARVSSVRTSTLAALLWTVALPNTSSSEL